MSDNPYLHKGDEWYLTPHIEIAPDPKDMEIERLRARVEVLEKVLEAAQAWREDMTMRTDHIRSGAIGRRLINALAEVKP